MKANKTKEDIHKELESLAPTVASILKAKKEAEIPFRYFESLPDQVLDRIIQEPQKENTFWQRIRQSVLPIQMKWVLATTCFIGIVGYIAFMFSAKTSQVPEFNDLVVEDVRSYLMENAIDLDEPQLNILSAGTSITTLYEISDQEMDYLFDEYVDQMEEKL
jgi:hypothetical protein